MMGALPGVRRLSRTSSSLEKREHCQPWLLSHSYFPYFFTFFFFFFFFFFPLFYLLSRQFQHPHTAPYIYQREESYIFGYPYSVLRTCRYLYAVILVMLCFAGLCRKKGLHSKGPRP